MIRYRSTRSRFKGWPGFSPTSTSSRCNARPGLVYLSLLRWRKKGVQAVAPGAPVAAEQQQDVDLFRPPGTRLPPWPTQSTDFDSSAPGAVFLGTDVRERWEKDAFQKWAAPYFQRPSAWIFSASRRRVYLSSDGNTAWFDEDLISKSYWPCRGSGVLEKINGQWKIRQYNMAFTIPNEATAGIRPMIEEAFKNQLPAAK